MYSFVLFLFLRTLTSPNWVNVSQVSNLQNLGCWLTEFSTFFKCKYMHIFSYNSTCMHNFLKISLYATACLFNLCTLTFLQLHNKKDDCIYLQLYIHEVIIINDACGQLEKHSSIFFGEQTRIMELNSLYMCTCTFKYKCLSAIIFTYICVRV